jgi:multicomponent Na+:H+ antiporter subunit E
MGKQSTTRVLLRASALLGLWLALCGAAPSNLGAGAATAVAATWMSLRLLPSGRSRPSPAALASLVLHFLGQSVIAGADVAWRALDPRLPLKPGFVPYRAVSLSGTARNTFAVLTSLLPGTVPIGDESGQLVYHCLDVDQPVASQLATEESALSRALGR